MLPECTLEWLCDGSEPAAQPLTEQPSNFADKVNLVDKLLGSAHPGSIDPKDFDLLSGSSGRQWPLSLEGWARHLGVSNPARPSDFIGPRDYVSAWPPAPRGLVWLMRTRSEALWDHNEWHAILKKHDLSQHADDGLDLAAVRKAWPADGSLPATGNVNITAEEQRFGFTGIAREDNSSTSRGKMYTVKAQVQSAMNTMQMAVDGGVMCRSSHWKWAMERQQLIYGTTLAMAQQFLELRGGNAGQHLLTPIFAHVESSSITSGASEAAITQYLNGARTRALARGYVGAGEQFAAQGAKAKAAARYEQAVHLLIDLPSSECDLALLVQAATRRASLMSSQSTEKAKIAVAELEAILHDETTWQEASTLAELLREELVVARACVAVLTHANATEESRARGACGECKTKNEFTCSGWRKAAKSPGLAKCIGCTEAGSTLLPSASLQDVVMGMPVTAHEGECVVCLNEEVATHEQRTLPCFSSHWLCLTCLKDLAARNRNQSIVCPLCKAETRRPELEALLAETQRATASQPTPGQGPISVPPAAGQAAEAVETVDALYEAVYAIRVEQKELGVELGPKQIHSRLAQLRPDLTCSASAVKRASQEAGRALGGSSKQGATQSQQGVSRPADPPVTPRQGAAARTVARQPQRREAPSPNWNTTHRMTQEAVDMCERMRPTLHNLTVMEDLIRKNPIQAQAVLNAQGGQQYSVISLEGRQRLVPDNRNAPSREGASRSLLDMDPFELVATGTMSARQVKDMRQESRKPLPSR